MSVLSQTITAIEFNPNYAETYYNRGLVYDNKGEIDRAIVDYNRAIELNPSYAEAYSNRGIAYQSQGDYDLALEDFSKAIELDPNSAVPYNNRGNFTVKEAIMTVPSETMRYNSNQILPKRIIIAGWLISTKVIMILPLKILVRR